MAGAAGAQAAASSNAATRITLAAQPVAQAGATGAMSTGIRMAGSATAQAAAPASLGTMITFAGAAQVQAQAGSSMSTWVQMLGVAAATAITVGSLHVGASFLSKALAAPQAKAALFTVQEIDGDAYAEATAVGSLVSKGLGASSRSTWNRTTRIRENRTAVVPNEPRKARVARTTTRGTYLGIPVSDPGAIPTKTLEDPPWPPSKPM